MFAAGCCLRALFCVWLRQQAAASSRHQQHVAAAGRIRRYEYETKVAQTKDVFHTPYQNALPVFVCQAFCLRQLRGARMRFPNEG